MAANKTDLVRLLALNSGLTDAQAEAALDALPETAGRWVRHYGATGPGAYSAGVAGNLQFTLNRQANPSQWNLNITLDADGLNDFGNGTDRFGLPVVNA